ncbi:MAG: hypothetical protein Q8O87_04255 [bacterium]|nr:hypothetical protein [bacterium]
MTTTITDELVLPEGEVRLCAIYRNPETSEVAYEAYSLAEALAEQPTLNAEIIENGHTLAYCNATLWTLTSMGQHRLAWESKLLKERWKK